MVLATGGHNAVGVTSILSPNVVTFSAVPLVIRTVLYSSHISSRPSVLPVSFSSVTILLHFKICDVMLERRLYYFK